jgi:hypothetical protein
MPLILPGNVASATAGAYSIDNSCRFNEGDTPLLKKTFGTPTDNNTWTFSCWFKRGNGTSGSDVRHLFFGFTDASNESGILMRTQQLEVYNYSSSAYVTRKITTRVFRDPAAWYHLVVAWDSDDGAAEDRCKIYINGVRETSFGTNNLPGASEATHINEDGEDCTVGCAYNGASIQQWDGYMAEVVFSDGQAYAASDFGEFDEDSPTIWKPKDVSGLTFGNNGFYLDFEDSSNLGNDANGGTDLDETNVVAADQATDSPTNNFCVMNPLDNYYQGHTFSEGNCKIVTDSSKQNYTTATIGLTAGKWYWEVEYDAISGGADHVMIGIAGILVTSTSEQELGEHVQNWSYYSYDGDSHNNATFTTYGDAYTEGDIVGIALDLDNNNLYFSKNGTFQDSGDPTSGATGTGAISITDPASVDIGAYFPAASDWTGSQNATFLYNFGGCPAFAISSGNADDNGYGNFEYDVPAGFLAICTKNLGSDGG